MLRLIHLGGAVVAKQNDSEIKALVNTAVSILVLNIRQPQAVLTELQAASIFKLEEQLQKAM
jgi:hypothetical protein